MKLSSRKILIIDHSKKDCFKTKKILKKEGYQVICESSVQKAFETVQNELPDCILIDKDMPDPDGIKICRQLAGDPQLKHIPKILWTEKNDSQDIIDGINAGFEDFVAKSADPRILLVRIKSMLRIKKLHDKKIEDLRELKKLNQFKNEIILMLNHDLRVPINNIKGYNYAILDGQLGKISKEQRKIFKMQQDSLKRMMNLINSILNLKQIEAGKFIAKKEPVDIIKIVKTLKQELKPVFEKKGIEFSIENTIKNSHMKIDPAKISQVFQNLLQNAVKFTPEGGKIRFIIKIYCKDNVEFKIIDSGKGIPEDKLRKIFDPFYTKDESEEKRKITGLGVGLYICKKIVNIHGGKIKAYSEGIGKGTTFTIRLPRK